MTTQVWSPNAFPVGTYDPTRFQLVFPGLPNLEMFLNVISVPNVNLGMANHTTRLIDLKQPGEKLYFSVLECSFIFDVKMNNYKELYNWMKRISVMGLHESDVQDARLITEIGVFVFQNVYPISLGGAVFDATATDIQSPSCQVTFAYDLFYPEESL